MMNSKEIADNSRLAEEILGKWLRFRQFYELGFSQREITTSDDAELLQTTSSIASDLRKLSQRLDEKLFPFRGKEISALLKSSTGINHFRSMAEGDRRAFVKEWHTNKTYLARTVGAMKFLEEGYRLPVAGPKKGKKTKGKMKWVIIAVIAAVVGFGAASFFNLI